MPRGRHAPPLEVRLDVQRTRLFEAAATVFARSGYAEASAEAIAREAGMSKATFYEHFANKEECILALFDQAGALVLQAMADATSAAGHDSDARMRAGLAAFLDEVASHPAEAQTLLVEIIGAGPRAAERRDAILGAFADALDAERRERRHARSPRATTPSRSIAAGAELASRSLRRGEPADLRELAPVIERLIFGLLRR